MFYVYNVAEFAVIALGVLGIPVGIGAVLLLPQVAIPAGILQGSLFLWKRKAVVTRFVERVRWRMR